MIIYSMHLGGAENVEPLNRSENFSDFKRYILFCSVMSYYIKS